MTPHAILLILAVICFALAALRVEARIDWTNAGFAFVVAAWVVL